MPEVERLMHFAEVGFKERGIRNLGRARRQISPA